MTVAPFAGLGTGYRAILADPPWAFATRSPKGQGKSASQHYPMMDTAAIQALPVRELADPSGCALILWATAPMLGEAFDTMTDWGFKHVSTGAWAKQSPTGKSWAFGTGYRYRNAAEFWLLGTMGRVPMGARNIRNLIVAPVREHSRKPDVMHEMVEAGFQGPYLELFARQSRENWTTWGLERGKFDAVEKAPDRAE
ncbi:MAG: MT-A70 family methyltransferase [Bacteroidia bacterium]